VRAEALYSLARFHRLADRWADGYAAAERIWNMPEPADMLFMERDVYTWKAADELALCAFYLGHFDESLAINEQLLWNSQLPLNERNRILSNKGYSIANLRASSSPSSSPTKFMSIPQVIELGTVPRVTLTITTCKRRTLFERTMDSFLAMCTDTNLITRWICIDDDSSDEDRGLMQERYPFFEFILKPSSERGHVYSMNRLLYEVDSEYWVHLEDDWEFITQGPHISRAIQVLEEDPSLVQVVLNKNYAENTDYCDVVGGDLHVSSTGVPYRTHTFMPHGSPELAQLLSDNPGKVTSAHWPGFSLMPCVIRRERLTVGGAFNPGAGHFELEIAQVLQTNERRTAFFDDLVMLSLGKLRTDNSPDAPQNAYALNNTTQFRQFPLTPIDIYANWSDGFNIASLWNRQFCGGRPWLGATVDPAAPPARRHLVVNMPRNLNAPDSAASYLVHMEPDEGIRTFDEWTDPDPQQLAHFRSRRIAMNPFEWHLDCTFDELTTTRIVKTRDLSTVVSAKRFSVGHHLRLDFIHRLQEEGIGLDVWGRDLEHEFADQLGPLPWMDKRDGLFPYKYTIAVENNSEPNYATEKIIDAILSECLTFYWGCPNLGEIISDEAFIRLPLDNFDAAVEIVRLAIENDEYSKRLPAIRQAKRDILNKHQIAPMLGRIVNGERFVESLAIHVINLDRRPDRLAEFTDKLIDVAGDAFVDWIHRFSAVDGETLEMTDEIEHIFRGSELPLRRGQTACALSHLALWYEIANGDGRPGLIFEDDVTPDRDFLPRLTEITGQMVEAAWGGDVVFLDLAYFDDANRPFQFHQSLCAIDESVVMGGTSAYILSASGAQKLLTIALDEGIAYGIDTFILRNMHRVSCVQATPSLTRAPVARRGGDIVDSDIQYSGDVL
jgi:GR25 family glycosyltransferase involved in LPS biosynthesis